MKDLIHLINGFDVVNWSRVIGLIDSIALCRSSWQYYSLELTRRLYSRTEELFRIIFL
jgi:hypothetical protein